VPAGDTRPGDVVELGGRRLYVAAHLAGRVALEPLGPGGRRGGLSGSSVWVEPGDAVTLVEAYQSATAAGGAEVDPLRSP
jgi:NMD protein affecting ribosome stability and mRNA decay